MMNLKKKKKIGRLRYGIGRRQLYLLMSKDNYEKIEVSLLNE